MTDRIDFGGEPWKAIPNATLRDARLTAKAKGGLVSLLSHEEGWVRSAVATLRRENRIGRAQAQAILKELRDLGYADLITEQDEDGSLRSHYVIRAVSTDPAPHISQSPVAGEPGGSEPGRVGNRAAVVEALEEESLEEETGGLELASATPTKRPRDPIWDALVEIYGEPTSAGRGAMNTAAKALRDYGTTPDEMFATVRVLANTDFNWAVTTPNALAKHFGQRDALMAQADAPRVAKVPDRAAEIRAMNLGGR